MFNSLVVNFLVRQRVSTHVTTAIVEQLPIPIGTPHRRVPRNRGARAAAREKLRPRERSLRSTHASRRCIS